jgi:hypothetical protein
MAKHLRDEIVDRVPTDVVHPGDGLIYSPFDVTHSPGCQVCEAAIREAVGPLHGWVMIRALTRLGAELERRLQGK